MTSDFIRIFDRSVEEFRNYPNKKEIVEILFEAENNLDEIVDIVKDDILKSEGYIFANLLYLYPFSTPIVSEVLKSGFIEKRDLMKNLDIVFDSVSSLRNVLDNLKKMIKNSEGIEFSRIEERLKEIEKELKKYEDKLRKKKELKEKINKLNYLKNEVKDLEDLEKYFKRLKEAENTLRKLNKKINESKRLFKHLCKDEV